MTSIRHAFESEKSDGGDDTLVRPSDWNADHVVDGSLTGSGLLAYKAITVGDFTSISGASLADLDATNAVVTFTAPPSGAVMVRLSASTASPSGSSGSYQSWGLRESSTNIAGGAGDSIASRSVGTTDQYVGASKVFVLTGLTPGSSHTYKWSVAQSAGTGIIKANASSPAVMEVWDALTNGAVLTGTRIVRGAVNASSGTISVGTGFTVNRTGTGNFIITFTVPFSTTPVVVAGNREFGGSTNQRKVAAASVTATGFDVFTGDPNVAFADIDFSFIAIESSTGSDSNAPLASGIVRLTGGNFSTASTTFVDVTGASVTLTTGARRCRVSVAGSTSNNGTSHNGFDIEVDGTRIGAASTYGLELTRVAAADDWAAMSFTVDTDVLAAGSHTFKLKMRVGGGTGTLAANTTLSALVMSVTELSSSTAATNTGPPNELAHVEVTSSVSVTATSEGSAQTVVTAPALAFDGVTPVMIEYFCAEARPRGDTNGYITAYLFEDGSSLGEIALWRNANGSNQTEIPMVGRRRLTPSAGSHTYSIRSFVSGGTGLMGAGAGGPAAAPPLFIRITRAQLNGGATTVSQGTSFPGSPGTNERYYRTDLGMEFFYDGTRWLSTQLGQVPLSVTDVLLPFSAASTILRGIPPVHGGSDVYLLSAQAWFYISGGTALSGSHKWELALEKNNASTTTGLGTITIDSGASSVYRQSSPLAINALLGAFFEFGCAVNKTGTPGSFYGQVTISFRYVAT